MQRRPVSAVARVHGSAAFDQEGGDVTMSVFRRQVKGQGTLADDRATREQQASQGFVPVTSRQVERPPAIAIDRIGSGAFRQQELGGYQISRHRSKVQGSPLVYDAYRVADSKGVHLRAMLDQKLGQRIFRALQGHLQGRPLLVIALVHGCRVASQQHLYDAHITVLDGDVERRLTLAVAYIRAGAVLQKHARHRFASVLRGH